jgi:hypothetical protein
MALILSAPCWCANIFVSSSNIVAQSQSMSSNSWMKLTHPSALVTFTLDLLHLLLGVTGWLGFGVPSYSQSVVISGVVLSSFPGAAGGVVQATVSVGAGRIVQASFVVGAGGI